MTQVPLPQRDRLFLTDAGLETDMLFNRGFDLPYFASITLLRSAEGRAALESYFCDFLELARRMACGLVLESATWRASPDWAEPLGLSQTELDDLNTAAVAMLTALRQRYQASVPDIIVSGCVGPRGDGHDPGRIMAVDEAEAYHAQQARVLMAAGADLLTGITMTNVPEAIGLVRAASRLDAPVVISFTVETDGRLPGGNLLAEAVMAVDAATDSAPAYYMINCAHPTHFATVLDPAAAWTARIRGVRANASRCSHAELDAMTELDMGDIADLAARHRTLRDQFPTINVLGGCCGTDLRHVTAIAAACLGPG